MHSRFGSPGSSYARPINMHRTYSLRFSSATEGTITQLCKSTLVSTANHLGCGIISIEPHDTLAPPKACHNERALQRHQHHYQISLARKTSNLIVLSTRAASRSCLITVAQSNQLTSTDETSNPACIRITVDPMGE